jgi:uncharacterized protein YfaT (DUF1175 family)
VDYIKNECLSPEGSENPAVGLVCFSWFLKATTEALKKYRKTAKTARSCNGLLEIASKKSKKKH